MCICSYLDVSYNRGATVTCRNPFIENVAKTLISLCIYASALKLRIHLMYKHNTIRHTTVQLFWLSVCIKG